MSASAKSQLMRCSRHIGTARGTQNRVRIVGGAQHRRTPQKPGRFKKTKYVARSFEWQCCG